MPNDANQNDLENDILPGVSRAAILLLAMGADNAGRIIQHLSDEEVSQVVQTVSRLGQIPTTVVENLVDEFQQQLNKDPGLVGSEDTALALITESLPDDRSKKLQAEFRGDSSDDVWPKLPSLPIETTAERLAQEHPQVAAYIVSRLDADFSSELLTALEEDLRSDILNRILNMNSVQERASALLAKCLSGLVENLSEMASSKDNYSKIAQIANLLEKDVAETALQAIAQNNPDDAAEIEKLIFRFEEMVRLPEEAMTSVCSSIPNEHIIAALTGADEEICEAILGSLSPRNRRMIESDLKSKSNRSAAEIKSSRSFISNTVLRLVQSGDIELEADDTQSSA